MKGLIRDTDEFKKVLEARRKKLEGENGKSEKVSEEVKKELIDEEVEKFAVGDKSPAWDKINLAFDKAFKSMLADISKSASKIASESASKSASEAVYESASKAVSEAISGALSRPNKMKWDPKTGMICKISPNFSPKLMPELKSELSDRASAKANELKEKSESTYIKLLSDEVNKSEYRKLVKSYYDAGSDYKKSMEFFNKALAEWNTAVSKAREKFSEIIGESFEDWVKKCKPKEKDLKVSIDKAMDKYTKSMSKSGGTHTVFEDKD